MAFLACTSTDRYRTIGPGVCYAGPIPLRYLIQLAVQDTDGAAVVPVADPMKPKVVLVPAAMLPLWLTLRAVTVEPLADTVAFQAWLTFSPLAKLQVTVQPLIAEPPAVTRISAWKPPGH